MHLRGRGEPWSMHAPDPVIRQTAVQGPAQRRGGAGRKKRAKKCGNTTHLSPISYNSALSRPGASTICRKTRVVSDSGRKTQESEGWIEARWLLRGSTTTISTAHSMDSATATSVLRWKTQPGCRRNANGHFPSLKWGSWTWWGGQTRRWACLPRSSPCQLNHHPYAQRSHRSRTASRRSTRPRVGRRFHRRGLRADATGDRQFGACALSPRDVRHGASRTAIVDTSE